MISEDFFGGFALILAVCFALGYVFDAGIYGAIIGAVLGIAFGIYCQAQRGRNRYNGK